MTLCHLATGRQLFAHELTTCKINASTSKSVSNFDKLNFLTERRYLNLGMTCIWRHNTLLLTVIEMLLLVTKQKRGKATNCHPLAINSF